MGPGHAAHEFFGFRESPFGSAPGPQFHFDGASQTAALEGVASAVLQGEAVVVVTGSAGAGKTALCQRVAKRCGPRAFVAMTDRPPSNGDDLLRQVLDGFGMHADAHGTVRVNRHALLDILRRFLVSLGPLQAEAIAVVDEAHLVDSEALASLQLLTSLEADGRRLIHVVLVGQPELADRLARPDLRLLNDRVTRRYELAGLTPEEVPEYMRHRLNVARENWPGDDDGETRSGRTVLHAVPGGVGPFTAAAVEAIVELSGGVPGVVNVVCDYALDDAFHHRTRRVDRPGILRAARTASLTVPLGLQARSAARHVAATTVPLLVVAAVAIGWAIRARLLPAEPAVAASPSASSSGVHPMASAPRPAPALSSALATPPASERRPSTPESERRGDSTAPANARGDVAAAALEPLDTLLRRAEALSVQPDVKALVHVRDDVVARRTRADGASRTEIEAALQTLDRQIADARRRQLLIDGRRLFEHERGDQSR